MSSIEKPIIHKVRSAVPEEVRIVEAFESALGELFFIDHPNFKKTMPEAQEQLKAFLTNHGIGEIWVYYPWRNIAVHTVPEDVYFKLRTARNKNLITQEEQLQYRNSRVGIAGLSVGASVFNALVQTGGPKVMKIADFDTLELTNLNRIRAGLLDLGEQKSHVVVRSAYELDPFGDFHIWEQGVSLETIREFIVGEPKLQVLVDEMDSLAVKLQARMVCKEHGIPLLSALDDGDGVMLDVERYDLDPDYPPFHGLLGDTTLEDLKKITPQEWVRLATKVIGPEWMPERLQESMLQIGKTVAGAPQLGSTAAMTGTVVSYAIRRIVNGQEVRSGKHWINLEQTFDPGFNNQENLERRRQRTEALKQALGL